MSDQSVRPANCAGCAFWRKLREQEGLCARHAPEPSIRPDEAAHFPQTHNWQWCGEGVAAEPMSIGSRCADCLYWRRPDGGLNPSTVATCRWPGGLRRELRPPCAAPGSRAGTAGILARHARRRLLRRGPAAARRRGASAAAMTGSAPTPERRRGQRFQARTTPRKRPSRTRPANALLHKF